MRSASLCIIDARSSTLISDQTLNPSRAAETASLAIFASPLDTSARTSLGLFGLMTVNFLSDETRFPLI